MPKQSSGFRARNGRLCHLVLAYIRLPRHQFQRLAAQQPRDNRHLALNRKALGAIPVDARRGAYASFGGAMTALTRFMVATSFSVLATVADASPVWVKWGCAARSPANYWANSYNDNTKAQASTEALKGCQAAGGEGCRIISCSANMNTERQANTMWPPPAPTTIRNFRRLLG
jgi:hypothetical protein